MTATSYYRLAIGIALGTVLFLVLAVGAVGIIGAGGRPDRIYAVVPAVLAIGTVIARLRPGGMALALLATALTQVVVTATALLAGLHQTPSASVVDIVGITGMYAGLFTLSAWTFHRAAEERAEAPVSSPF